MQVLLILLTPIVTTLWLVIYLAYKRIKVAQHNLHLLIDHSSRDLRLKFEIYSPDNDTAATSSWTSGWANPDLNN